MHRKGLQNEHVPGSTGEVAGNSLKLLDLDTTQIFVSRLKDVAREPYPLPLQAIQMKFLKSGCVLWGLVPELKHQDKDDHGIIKPSTYPKWLQRSFKTVGFCARKTLKNMFRATSYLASTGKIPNHKDSSFIPIGHTGFSHYRCVHLCIVHVLYKRA